MAEIFLARPKMAQSASQPTGGRAPFQRRCSTVLPNTAKSLMCDLV